MEVETQNVVQLVKKGEKGNYILSLPVGSQLEESLQVATQFVAALSHSLSQYKEKIAKNEEQEDESTSQ